MAVIVLRLITRFVFVLVCRPKAVFCSVFSASVFVLLVNKVLNKYAYAYII